MLRRIAPRWALLLVSIAGCTSNLSPSSPQSSWPNEPEGMTLLSDWGFDQTPPLAGDVAIPGSPGWSVVYGTPPDPMFGTVRLAADPASPFSPPNVYDIEYPMGMVEGTAPTTIYFPRSGGIASRARQVLAMDRNGLGWEVYVGFWWKPSSPFDLGPNGNKIAFLFNGGGAAGGQQFLILMPDGRLHVLPEYPNDFRWRDPNVAAAPVVLGAWHRIEWYANAKTGVLKWWMDGTLQGNYADVTNAFAFDVFKLSPTWGGNTGAKKRETDHYYFDHIRLSAR